MLGGVVPGRVAFILFEKYHQSTPACKKPRDVADGGKPVGSGTSYEETATTPRAFSGNLAQSYHLAAF
jgi:hypothetical protein